MRNKSLSLRLALVLLLITMHLLRQMFPDSWALGFWALVVDAFIFLVIVGEIIGRWLLGRYRSSIDERVLDFLALDTTFPKTVEEIQAGASIKCRKTVMASLRRLKLHHQVDQDKGRWRKTVF